MATKAAAAAETTETREEAAEGPLIDATAATIKKMVARGKERGYLTYDELNAALPPDQVSSEQIEDTMTMLSELGINVIENEESEEPAAAEAEEGDAEVRGNLDDDDIGRTDDPVRMYLREMGSVELLSREGEIAIAKRIEAGREAMSAGLCESPLTFQALIIWRDELTKERCSCATSSISRRPMRGPAPRRCRGCRAWPRPVRRVRREPRCPRRAIRPPRPPGLPEPPQPAQPRLPVRRALPSWPQRPRPIRRRSPCRRR